jgi:hypothetical protein
VRDVDIEHVWTCEGVWIRKQGRNGMREGYTESPNLDECFLGGRSQNIRPTVRLQLKGSSIWKLHCGISIPPNTLRTSDYLGYGLLNERIIANARFEFRLLWKRALPCFRQLRTHRRH